MLSDAFRKHLIDMPLKKPRLDVAVVNPLNDQPRG
jgi:hypothetical protein